MTVIHNFQTRRRLVFVLQCLMLPVAMIGTLFFQQPEEWRQILVYASGSAVFAGMLVWWFKMHPRSTDSENVLRRNGVGLFYAGVVVTALPLVYFSFTAVFGAYKASQIALFKNMIEVTGYREEPIVWEGIEHPVGVRVILDLKYPTYPGGWIRHPRIVVSGETALAQAGVSEKGISNEPDRYWVSCQAPVVEGEGCFTQPIWPEKSFLELPVAGTAQVIYELFPSNLNYMDGAKQLCLRERSPYSGVKSRLPVKVYWHLAYNNHIHDIAPVLQDAIDKNSTFFTSTQSIEGAYASVQSNEFVIAGFQNCQIKTAIRYSEESECFCKEPSSAENNAGKPALQ